MSRADWVTGSEEGMSAKKVDPEEPGAPIPFERPKLVRRDPAESAPVLPEPGHVEVRRSSPPKPEQGEPRVNRHTPLPPKQAPPPSPQPKPVGGPPPLKQAPAPPPAASRQPPGTVPAPRPVAPAPRPVAAPAAPPEPTMPKWDAGQNSVPMIRREQEARFVPSSPIPELTRDFPMDDAEERARVAAEIAEQRAEEDAIAARPHHVVSPTDFVLPEAAPPWWQNIPALLASDRRAQLAALCVVLVVALMTFWPRAEKTISVGHLTEHAQRYADDQVRVSGRVAEVFPVGGSWAFTLIQGRDTIVVFTRTRQPRRDERVVVVGTLSTGFLDGVSRAAIFESTAR